MAFEHIKQPDYIQVNDWIRLREVSEEDYQAALSWYQNTNVLYYSDGKDSKAYTIERVKKMYDYLANIGEVYVIEVLEEGWKAIGDATLSPNTMPIVIGCEEYWGKRIGALVLEKLIERAKQLGFEKITLKGIMKYNMRSQRLYQSMGFVKTTESEIDDQFELILIK